jgi:Brp/Blh family beta-carotene 15,15'-monooxygenase
MLNIQKYSMLLSFLGLWLTSYLTAEFQNMLGLGLIFSFGILHGANDLKLIDRLEQGKKVSFFKVLGSYVILVLLSVLLFMKIPVTALFIFIVVSAYHFGEQNWIELLKDCSKLVRTLFQFSYGMLILSTLFYFNSEEVKKIIFKIASINTEQTQFLAILLISLVMYIILSLLLLRNNNSLKTVIFEQTFYILLLCIIFKVSSLFLGFAIYFIFWHSIPSLYDQIKFLYGSYSFGNFKKYFKSASVYWIVSLAGVFGLYAISKDMVIFDALFFSFLASITFPHFIIMLKMYKK